MSLVQNIAYHGASGLIVGIVAAAPIGPVNLLVIQRAVRAEHRGALTLGMGAALGDAFFAAIAAFGLGALGSLLRVNQDSLKVAGGLVMLAFGLFLWRRAPQRQRDDRPPIRTRHMMVAVMGITITNPATLLWFGAAFAMFRFSNIGHGDMSSLINALALTLGVFAGSMLWWLLLVALAARLRSRIQERHLLWINHGTAIILIAAGLAALLTAH